MINSVKKLAMLTASPRAINKIQDIINKKNGQAILLYLQGGGCSGMKYQFEVLDINKKEDKLDEIVKIDDVSIHMCGKSLLYTMGTHIDYIDDDIMGSRFDFSNDNINGKCGCGTSIRFNK